MWTTKGPLTKCDMLRGGLQGGLPDSETSSNHIGWPEMNTSWQKWVMAGSHVLGRHPSCQRSASAEPVCWLVPSLIHAFAVSGSFPFWGEPLTAPVQIPQNPSLLLLPCSLVTANFYITTCVKKCFYLFLPSIQSQRVCALLSPTSLIHHQWISCNPSGLLLRFWSIK